MNKKEAAEFLGVSERTLTNYTAASRLPVSYIKGKTRDVADFDQENLARLKAELESGNIELGNRETGNGKSGNSEIGNGKPGNLETGKESGNREIALVSTRLPVQSRQPGNQEIEQSSNVFYVLGAEQLEELIERLPATSPPLEARLTLTLAEAQALSGVSLRRLRVAIKAGELTSRRLGRADRIRPADLRLWLDRQFED